MRLRPRCRARSYRSSVDLSGIIFAGLAVAWAVYLIPKALRHHDEMAKTRSVDRFSHTMRVLGRHGESSSRPKPASQDAARPEAHQVSTPPVPQASARQTIAPRARSAAPRRHPVTREAARRAAARRRRVLGLLLLLLVAVAGLAGAGVVPWWTVAVPAGLVVLFLVTARITVRREQRRAAPLSVEAVDEADDGREDTVEVDREELAAAVAAPLADEGSLWDPLPLTLPTYVNKARARRTVRTIELTQTAGVTSSGHDVDDSALVAAAEETATEETVEQRKVAGA